MRISDWSSDVCSSDLDGPDQSVDLAPDAGVGDPVEGLNELQGIIPTEEVAHPLVGGICRRAALGGLRLAAGLQPVEEVGHRHPQHASQMRSEEHTSELQSLMRISYAVFCLKKKNK